MAKRFRIALSYSGTKRAFVAETAKILAERFGQDRILYDKYHQAEFARGNLAFHLPALYYDESDLVVVIYSKGYEASEWCGLEWNAIYGLCKQRKDDDVMLCRFDKVEPRGLYGLAGFIDLDEIAPRDLSGFIYERLAHNEGYPKDYYTRAAPDGPDWPVAAPPVEWPVANHTEAQGAFKELITRESRFRLLPISGVSETGKSHLTKQFVRNALKLPGITCGRFDFKGSSDMDAELSAFAERLGVPSPTPGTGVSNQLAQVFATIRKNATPTLLIFDTFELAGDAERWLKDNLLLSIIQAAWLRVIVVGQRVPMPPGEPWAGQSSPPIALRLPSAEEWFAYGQLHNPSPELTLDFVKKAYALAKGKSSVLAQLCSPGA